MSTGATLTVDLNEPCTGRLTGTLLGYDSHFPTKSLWTGSGHYPGPSGLTLDLNNGLVSHSPGRSGVGAKPPLFLARRFCWRLALIEHGRNPARAAHWDSDVPVMRGTVGSDYFCGENYVDHEAESAGDHRQMVELLRRHHGQGPVLEIGCATGGFLAELDAAGVPTFGLDVSEWPWAAPGTLGPGRAWVCDVERDPLPASMKSKGPFGVLVLSSVSSTSAPVRGPDQDHRALPAPRTVLVITTTNARALSHALLGRSRSGKGTSTGLILGSTG